MGSHAMPVALTSGTSWQHNLSELLHAVSCVCKAFEWFNQLLW